jgi:hypothetical protein
VLSQPPKRTGLTDVPFEAGTDLDNGRVVETIRGMRMALAANALEQEGADLERGSEPQRLGCLGVETGDHVVYERRSSFVGCLSTWAVIELR